MRLILLTSAALLLQATTNAISGETACEHKSLDKIQCVAVGCCEYSEGKCFSATDGECVKKTVKTIPTYAPGKHTPTWVKGEGSYSSCALTTTVFNVPICATSKAAKSTIQLNHIAQITLQLLDNDNDGKADDTKVVQKMLDGDYFLHVPFDEEDKEEAPNLGTGQVTGVWEAVPKSCDVPSFRGADNKDRSTWMKARTNTPGNTGCKKERDATVEEVLHLITTAAGELWPDKWGPVKTSAAGKAAYLANGNCGWGYDNTIKKPINGITPACVGVYSYSDKTCTEDCIVVEAIYWSSVSYIGGLFTNDRAKSVSNEWLMTVPNLNMKLAVLSDDKNAKTLEEGSPALFKLVSDTTGEQHKWLPATMPDGIYTVSGSGGGLAPSGGFGSDSSGSRMASDIVTVFVVAVTMVVLL